MNWRRGLLRLWLVASLLWFICVLGYAWFDHSRSGSPWFSEFAAAVIFTLVPVIIVFGLGVAIFWVIAGFKPRGSN
jgi:hypothetical protein